MIGETADDGDARASISEGGGEGRGEGRTEPSYSSMDRQPAHWKR